MLATQTANASRVTSSSGGGESANIYMPPSSTTSLSPTSHGPLPCESPSRTLCYQPAVSHSSSGLTNSVIVSEAPLSRTHCPPPPYCLSSLARSSYHTTHTSVTVYDGHWQRRLDAANAKGFASSPRRSAPVGAVSECQRRVECTSLCPSTLVSRVDHFVRHEPHGRYKHSALMT